MDDSGAWPYETFDSPHRVVFTNFRYEVNKLYLLELLIRNPLPLHVPISVKIYAFGNAWGNLSEAERFMYDDQLMGWSEIQEAY